MGFILKFRMNDEISLVTSNCGCDNDSIGPIRSSSKLADGVRVGSGGQVSHPLGLSWSA